MMVGLNITKRGSWVMSEAPPKPMTSARLSHCMTPTGFLRASSTPIWPMPKTIPHTMPIVTP